MRYHAVAGGSTNSCTAFAGGAVFVILGIAGFLTSAERDAAGGLRADMLVAVVHLAAGAALVAAGILGHRQAKHANVVVGAGCLLLFLMGLAVTGTAGNIAGLTGADNALHLACGVALTAVALGADRAPR